MLTLVRIPDSRTSAADTSALVADYLVFDRQRTSRRRYLKFLGGLAAIVLLAAALGRVPAGEAGIAVAALIAPTLVLLSIELIAWQRLVRRRDRIRAAVARAKVVKRS